MRHISDYLQDDIVPKWTQGFVIVHAWYWIQSISRVPKLSQLHWNQRINIFTTEILLSCQVFVLIYRNSRSIIILVKFYDSSKYKSRDYWFRLHRFEWRLSSPFLRLWREDKHTPSNPFHNFRKSISSRRTVPISHHQRGEFNLYSSLSTG